MTNQKTIPFEFEGKQYEVRVVSDGFHVRIRAFLNGEPANGYIYSVDFPTTFDIMRKFQDDPVQELVNDAIKDVKGKIWERYLRIPKP
jgi:hypothetical protein